jgi:hypothetical protein
MKLDPSTIAILQNFQTINQSILIKPGNLIKTISPSKSLFATAVVPNTFEQQFCIYDLSRFLGLLSLKQNSDISFKEDHLIITQDNGYKTRYTYCNPELILIPPDKEIQMPEPFCTFTLSKDVLQSVFKAMQILGFNEIQFSGQNGVLSVSAVNTKNPSADIYSAEIGQIGKNFSAIIEAEKMKLLNTDYTVEIASKGLSHFIGKDVQYWIALSAKSSFDV